MDVQVQRIGQLRVEPGRKPDENSSHGLSHGLHRFREANRTGNYLFSVNHALKLLGKKSAFGSVSCNIYAWVRTRYYVFSLDTQRHAAKELWI